MELNLLNAIKTVQEKSIGIKYDEISNTLYLTIVNEDLEEIDFEKELTKSYSKNCSKLKDNKIFEHVTDQTSVISVRKDKIKIYTQDMNWVKQISNN